jgi:hypothetical protein
MTALGDLTGQTFAGVPVVARVLGRDQRTIRRAAEKGLIPATKIGSRWAIPVAWLRSQAGGTGAPQAPTGPDLDELADRVADRVVSRLADLQAFIDAGVQGAPS